MWRGALRVTFWGALAMAFTAARRLGLRRLDGVMAPALPKVRALTAGVDLETLGDWAPVETALGLLARARARLAREGFEVQLARLSLPPLLARLDPPRRWTSLAHVRQLDAMAGEAGVVVSVGPLAVEDTPDGANPGLATWIADLNAATAHTHASVVIASPEGGVHRQQHGDRRRRDARHRGRVRRRPGQLPLRRRGAGAGDDAVLPRRAASRRAGNLGRARIGAPGARRRARGAARGRGRAPASSRTSARR